MLIVAIEFETQLTPLTRSHRLSCNLTTQEKREQFDKLIWQIRRSGRQETAVQRQKNLLAVGFREPSRCNDVTLGRRGPGTSLCSEKTRSTPQPRTRINDYRYVQYINRQQVDRRQSTVPATCEAIHLDAEKLCRQAGILFLSISSCQVRIILQRTRRPLRSNIVALCCLPHLHCCRSMRPNQGDFAPRQKRSSACSRLRRGREEFSLEAAYGTCR